MFGRHKPKKASHLLKVWYKTLQSRLSRDRLSERSSSPSSPHSPPKARAARSFKSPTETAVGTLEIEEDEGLLLRTTGSIAWHKVGACLSRINPFQLLSSHSHCLSYPVLGLLVFCPFYLSLHFHYQLHTNALTVDERTTLIGFSDLDPAAIIFFVLVIIGALIVVVVCALVGDRHDGASHRQRKREELAAQKRLEGQDVDTAANRYVGTLDDDVKFLSAGHETLASHGLCEFMSMYMDVDKTKLALAISRGTSAIWSECEAAVQAAETASFDSTPEALIERKDAFECVRYIMYQKAGTSDREFDGPDGKPRIRDHERKQRSRYLPANPLLHDFVKHPDAQRAGLNEAHVVAVRLYTTEAYKGLIKPLRDAVNARPVGSLLMHRKLRSLNALASSKSSRISFANQGSSRESIRESSYQSIEQPANENNSIVADLHQALLEAFSSRHGDRPLRKLFGQHQMIRVLLAKKELGSDPTRELEPELRNAGLSMSDKIMARLLPPERHEHEVSQLVSIRRPLDITPFPPLCFPRVLTQSWWIETRIRSSSSKCFLHTRTR